VVAIWAFFLDDVPILHEILPSYQMRKKSLFIGHPREIGWVAGTALWVRRDVWKKIGGFDEHLFMYGEDVELCYRSHEMGWKVLLNPKASLVHKGQGSSTEARYRTVPGEARWVTGEIEGLLYLFKKQKPSWEMPVLKLILAVAMALRWFIFGILGSNENLRRAYAQAFRVARS
jgi:GT2 family glycosyltransferase